MRYLYSVYADAASIALQSILAHKLRAFLTLIGIIIGVAAVVVVGASVSGLNTYVTERVAKLLGATGMSVIMRLSSFLLVCIGVQIVWNGASVLLGSLAK